MFPSKHVPFVDWSRFPDSCTSCYGYGRENAQDWNCCRRSGRERSWTPGVAVESARLTQRDEFDRGYRSPSPCKTDETASSNWKIAPVNSHIFDQFTLLFLGHCTKGFWSVPLLVIDVALHVLIQLATIALTKLSGRGVFSTLTVRTVVPTILPLPLNPVVSQLK